MKVGRRIRLAVLAFFAVVQTVPGLAGGNRPKISVERWDLPGISSPLWESHPAIDPSTGDLWFVRSDRTFSGWRILTSRCRDGHWSVPEDMPFAAPGNRSRSLVQCRRNDVVLHLQQVVRRERESCAGYMENAANLRRSMATPGVAASASELRSGRVVSTARCGWLVVFRLEARRRIRQGRYLAGAPEQGRPMDRRKCGSRAQHARRGI